MAVPVRPLRKEGAPESQGPPEAPRARVPWLSPGRMVGGLLGIVAVLVLWNLHFTGLSAAGQHGLALVIGAICWWVFDVVNPAVTALLFITLIITLGVDTPSRFLINWTSSTMWFIVASFAFGAVVSLTSLAQRIGLYLLKWFGRSFFGMALAFVLLNIVFSVLGVASSFPRVAITFGILEGMAIALKLPKGSQALTALAMAITSALQPGAEVTYTGNLLSPLTIGLAKVPMTYFQWIGLMAVPSLVMAGITLLLVYYMFRPREPLSMPRADTEAGLRALGPMSRRDWHALALIGLAIVLWMTQSLHHIDPGWVALGVAALMMLPGVGVITWDDFRKSVTWHIVFFLTATYAIGALATDVGIAPWLGHIMLPATPPQSPYVLSLLLSVVVMALHLVTGSATSSLGVLVPTVTGWASAQGLNPTVFALMVLWSIWMQQFFTYQQAGALMAFGYGHFGIKDLAKFGVGLFVITPLVLAFVAVPYWLMIGAFVK